MPVLPSFKSTFSSLAEADVAAGVRVADDSGFASSQLASTSNSGPARHSPFQDHFPARAQPSTAWSFLQTTTTAASTATEPPKPDLIRHPLQPPRPRPAVAPLPLDQLSAEAPAFYFDSRLGREPAPGSTARRSLLDPVPVDSLTFASEGLTVRPESLKRTHSPSVHAGAYKRPRSQSVSAGESYVKVQSQSSSERLAKTAPPSGRDRSGSTGRQTPNDRLSSASAQGTHSPRSRRDSVKVSGLLSSTTLTKPTSSKTYTRPNTAGISLPRLVSASRDLSETPSQRPRRGIASGSVNAGHDAQKLGVGASTGHRASPSHSTLALGNVRTNSSIPLPSVGRTSNLVSFPAPSFSHRSGGSKGFIHGYNTRILGEIDIIEDSTCRVAVDVLSSPRARSLNSTVTGRTGPLRGALGQTLTLSRGPTASDISVLLGHTRHERQDRDEKSKVADESETAVPERQKQSMTTTDSLVASEGEPFAHRTETGDPMNLSSIVKSTSMDDDDEYNRNGLTIRNGNDEVKGSSHVLNGRTRQSHGSLENGEATTTTNLWGGQGTSTETRRWIGKGDSSREQVQVESWRQGPRPTVAKAEENCGVLDVDRNRRRTVRGGPLWGGQGSQEARGIGSAVMNGYTGRDGEREGGGKQGESRYGMTERKVRSRSEDGGEGEEDMVGGERMRMKGLNDEKCGDEGDDGNSVQCPHCERRLRNVVTLQNHVKVVHDHSGNFQCDRCGLTFMWRSTMLNHVRLVHLKQRPYDCKECNKAFRWKSHLREHIWVVHKREKPFECQTCGKTFGRKNNMQKHMRKHSEAAS